MRWMAVGLLLLALVLGTWLVLDADRAQIEPVAGSATRPVDEAPVPELPAPSGTDPEALVLANPVERLALDQPSTALQGTGTIVDLLGRSVEGAVISWTPLAPQRTGPPPPWQEVDWRAIDEETHWTESDGSGAFAFTDAPSNTDESVLWITHPGYVAQHVLVPEGEERATEWQITLDETPPRRVVVLGEAEARVEGAVVRQFAGAAQDGADREASRAREAFFREWRTDRTGEVQIATFAGHEGLVASLEGLTSPPLTRPCGGDVTIRLFPSFEAMGAVVLTDGGAIGDGVRVFYDARAGDDEWERLGAVSVAGSGDWGPVDVALSGAEEYLFSVEGGGVVRKAVSVSRPLAGEEIRVDIETILGVDQWFRISDSKTHEPLAEASVEVHWHEDDGRWTKTEFHAREDGYVLARGCQPGTIWLMIRCPGYAFKRGGPEVLPTGEPQTFLYTLDQAGNVRGRCLLAGQPVSDFEILYWPGDRVDQLWNEVFVDREDGSFTLEGVAAGGLSLVAHGAGHGQSEMVRAEVPPGGEAEVLLEVSKPGSAHGVVVDQVSGDPIAGASVQLFATRGTRPIYETGSALLTDDDGRFRIEGLSEVAATAVITRTGYGARNVTAVASGGASVDLGKIVMTRAQPLEVRLHTPAGVDPTQYSVRTLAQGLPTTPFSSEGVVFVEEFSTDDPTFVVMFPGGEELSQPAILLPGEEWVVDIILNGSARLNLEVLPEKEAGSLPSRLWAYVRYPWDAGAVDRKVNLPDSGSLIIEHLVPGPVHVDVRDDRCTLVSRPVELAPGETTNLQLRLSGELRRFRVVDAEGRALPSTRVRFIVNGSEDAALGGYSDSKGELLTAGLGDGVVTAHLTSPQAGIATHVPVELGPDLGQTVVLPLVAGESLSIRLLDGDGPAFGLGCRLFAGGSPYAMGPTRPSDASGSVSWTSIGEGEYDVHVDHPHYWPLRVSCATSDSQHVLHVRRRSAILLHARSSEGVDLPGVAVRLESEEFRTDVADWLEAGRIQASSSDMLTDAQGRLEVHGLPCGEYLWRVQAAGSEPFGGQVDVPCDEPGEVVATFP